MNYLSYIKTVTASLVRFVVYSYQQHFISLQFIFPKSYANSPLVFVLNCDDFNVSLDHRVHL